MTLRDFCKKSKSTKPLTKFVLQNDAAENKYKTQLDELNTQLEHYRNIEAERDLAVKRAASTKETLKSERQETSLIRESITGLHKTIQDQSSALDKIPNLEEERRAYKGQLGLKTSELDIMTKRAVEQSQDLSRLKNQLEITKSEYNTLETSAKEAISLKRSIAVDFEAVSNKNKELQSFTDETSKINKELAEKNNSLIHLTNSNDVQNKELVIQLEELKTVENKLRKWMGNMETKYSNTTSSKNSLENKVFTQQKVITDMRKNLDDIITEMSYVTKLNKQYKEELARPKFMSMGAIAKTEGFVMPQGKENIRTHNLGNSGPTLLKFKPKEEESYGR